MATNKTNQPTTERTTEQIMRDLDLARLMREPEAIERLSAELKKAINKIFSADGVPFHPTDAEHVEALAEDYNKDLCAWVAIENAHRLALMEEAERKAADEREQSDMDE